MRQGCGSLAGRLVRPRARHLRLAATGTVPVVAWLSHPLGLLVALDAYGSCQEVKLLSTQCLARAKARGAGSCAVMQKGIRACLSSSALGL
jgi:hypothetical protein